jgi:hypothetical protein
MPSISGLFEVGSGCDRKDLAVHGERKPPQAQSKDRQQQFDFHLCDVGEKREQQIEQKSGKGEIFQGSGLVRVDGDQAQNFAYSS